MKKTEEDFDSHGDGGGRWKGVPSGLPEDPEKAGQKASLSVSQTGSWRRGMSAQGGAPSRQKAGTSALKTPGRLVPWQLLLKSVLLYCFHLIFVLFHNSFFFSLNHIPLHMVKCFFIRKFHILYHINPHEHINLGIL